MGRGATHPVRVGRRLFVIGRPLVFERCVEGDTSNVLVDGQGVLERRMGALFAIHSGKIMKSRNLARLGLLACGILLGCVRLFKVAVGVDA